MANEDTKSSPKDSAGESAESSRARSAVKAIGRLASRASALDVLTKDIKRVRPRNPEMWRQLFSAEGGRRLKEKVFGAAEPVNRSNPPKSQQVRMNMRRKNLIGSTITAILAFLAGTYIVAILGANEMNTVARVSTITSGFVFFVLAVVYGFIALQFATANAQSLRTKETATRKSNEQRIAAPDSDESQRAKPRNKINGRTSDD